MISYCVINTEATLIDQLGALGILLIVAQSTRKVLLGIGRYVGQKYKNDAYHFFNRHSQT